MIIHSDDAFAPVGYLKFKQMHLENKPDQVCLIDSMKHVSLLTLSLVI